jgi:NAD(P)-dependent dehydrogenase (short-subunit alcohol dehydrogenase family)
MTEDGLPLRDRRILVTGAASGIGRATAGLFVSCGARVAMLDKRRDALLDAAEELGGEPIVIDLEDSPAIPHAVHQASNALNGLDGIVNVAGIAPQHPLGDLTLERWNRVVSVNLTAPFLICQSALSHLRASGRPTTIVNVSSGASLLPMGTHSAYSASKGGLNSFSQALAFELGPDVRVNVVCPGMVETEGMSRAASLTDERRAAYVSRYALQRAASPAEIAHTILFLTADASSYITGSIVAVDGGRTFH